MRIEDLEEWIDDSEYWEQQPQVVLSNYSDYIIYPKQGLIWSCKRNKWVGAKDNKTGYWKCALIADDGTIWKTQLHRVIWTAVNGAIPQGYEINHIKEDKDDNKISSLELVTRKENCNFGTRNERVSKAISKTNTNNPKRSKAVGAYKEGELIMVFPSTNEAERQGYNSGNVSACCRNCFNREGNNIYKGYQWRYL